MWKGQRAGQHGAFEEFSECNGAMELLREVREECFEIRVKR